MPALAKQILRVPPSPGPAVCHMTQLNRSCCPDSCRQYGRRRAEMGIDQEVSPQPIPQFCLGIRSKFPGGGLGDNTSISTPAGRGFLRADGRKNGAGHQAPLINIIRGFPTRRPGKFVWKVEGRWFCPAPIQAQKRTFSCSTDLFLSFRFIIPSSRYFWSLCPPTFCALASFLLFFFFSFLRRSIQYYHSRIHILSLSYCSSPNILLRFFASRRCGERSAEKPGMALRSNTTLRTSLVRVGGIQNVP